MLGLLASDRGDSRLALLTGGAIYLAVLTIETVADAQKCFLNKIQVK